MTVAAHDMDGEGWEDYIARVYREVVEEGEQDGLTRDEAVKLVAERVQRDVETGRVVPPLDDAVRHAVERQDKKDSRLADRVLDTAARGQMSVFDRDEDDPFLEVVATLGNGLRKSWRWVTRADLREMDKLRYENARNAANAYDRWRQLYEAWEPILDRWSCFGDAITAGDVPENSNDD